MIRWVMRLVFLLLAVSFVFGAIEAVTSDGDSLAGSSQHYMRLVVWTSAIILVLGFLIDFLLPRKNVVSLAGVFFGVIVGLLIGGSLTKVIEMVLETYRFSDVAYAGVYKNLLIAMINLFCVFVTVIFVIQTKDDFRFIIPYVEFSKQTKGTMPVLLDTSVIIDGRIADIAATGIVNSPLIVPRFILNELQLVADSSDRLKRNRGRRGLDILNKMQSDTRLDVTIEDIDLGAKDRSEPVDLQLVAAAQKIGARIMTNDFNLNKVARLRGLEIININDLATAMKSVVLPGETLRIKMVKPGDQYGQGVGYLEDGTMIVVENGRSVMGRDVDIVVTSALQTSAGRMIFGKLATADNDN